MHHLEVQHLNKLYSYQIERHIYQHPPFHINVRHLFSSEECIIFQHHLICVPYNYAQLICLWFPRRDVQSWSRKGHVHRKHIHPHFQFSLHKQLHIYRCKFIQQAVSYTDVFRWCTTNDMGASVHQMRHDDLVNTGLGVLQLNITEGKVCGSSLCFISKAIEDILVNVSISEFTLKDSMQV